MRLLRYLQVDKYDLTCYLLGRYGRDLFLVSECSALDPVQPVFYSDLVSKCAGERIIKQRPGARFYLNANKMTLQQFTALFSEATHVELCINFQDMQWKQILFPKLLRLIPCGYGELNVHRTMKNGHIYSAR